MYDSKDVGRYVIWDEHELLDTKTGIVYISYTEKYFEDYIDSNDESKYKWFKKEVEFPK
tara:strand:+ start:546 stop:722 length:177 start_codon:yes stop_codon:yes gene_type:complete